MELSLINLAFLFVFLTILLLLSLIHSKLWWGLKAFLIIISVFFYYSSYTSLSSMLGRPTLEDVANNSLLIMHIDEAPSGSNKGRIIILVKDNKDYKLHQLPYSVDMVKKLKKVMQQASKDGSAPKNIIIKKTESKNGNNVNKKDELSFEVKEEKLPSKE